jgi:hypothetical protein
MNRLIYWIAAATTIITRVSLGVIQTFFFDPNNYVYVFGWRWHHFYTGIVMTIIGFLIPRPRIVRSLLLGVGLGLVIDEIWLPLQLTIFPQITYWSAASFITTAVALAAFVYWGVFADKTQNYNKE